MPEIDARGLACPTPVLQTKVEIEHHHPSEITVLVDNSAAKENISRFLSSRGYRVAFDRRGEDFVISGQSESLESLPEQPVETEETLPKRIMVMVSTDRLGFGDDRLGLKLMMNFIRTLPEMKPDLWRLVLVNNGVKLAVDGSEVLADLQKMADEGLSILVCGTCLDHFNLLGHKQVGETTNMLDIVTAMQVADKVINI
ncbi:MAG: sulfurtransferase-like selenium metabolism protein YedF [Desulfobacterales bacterium]